MAMDTEGKIATKYFPKEKVMDGLRCQPTEILGPLCYFSDLANIQQPNAHPDLDDGTLIQPGFCINEKMPNGTYETPGISWSNQSQAQSSSSRRYLEPKSGELELSCSDINARENTEGSFQSSRSFTRNVTSLGGDWHGKKRIRWTQELHEKFVAAVNSLGGAMKATPKRILELMKTPGLTVFHIKSHLQKYRMVKCTPSFLEGKTGQRNSSGWLSMSYIREKEVHLTDVLHLQMDVKKRLVEHFELQKRLQMRIEEHTTYLQHIIDQQTKCCSFLENDHLESIDKIFAQQTE